jgi:hypothetical protein
MQRPQFEIADIIKRFASEYIQKYSPNGYILRNLNALLYCRTAALGGHIDRCNCCGKERISYNSCGNRHCPKCQATKQAFWAEDRINEAFPVKHYHIVFTVPEQLNQICLLDSKWFYAHLFDAVWDILRTFGYSHYGVESGSICALHTWGQNLSLHPHVHCIVPAIGYSLKGKMILIGKNGKFLYPVCMLSAAFRKKFLNTIEKHLKHRELLSQYQPIINKLWTIP